MSEILRILHVKWEENRKNDLILIMFISISPPWKKQKFYAFLGNWHNRHIALTGVIS